MFLGVGGGGGGGGGGPGWHCQYLQPTTEQALMCNDPEAGGGGKIEALPGGKTSVSQPRQRL